MEGKKQLYINGEEFTVCGVYEDGGVLTQSGSADIPVIYSKIPEGSETLAEHLLIKAEEGKTADQYEKITKQEEKTERQEGKTERKTGNRQERFMS